jgi:hypothetical protein
MHGKGSERAGKRHAMGEIAEGIVARFQAAVDVERQAPIGVELPFMIARRQPDHAVEGARRRFETQVDLMADEKAHEAGSVSAWTMRIGLECSG